MYKFKLPDIEEKIAENTPDYKEFIDNFKTAFERDDTAPASHLAWPGGYFFGNDDIKKQFYRVGQFYLDAAHSLLTQLCEDNVDHRADGWILPILFLILHGTEMCLKGIRSCLYYAEENPLQAEKITDNQHDIKTICNICYKLLQHLKKELSVTTAKGVDNAILVIDFFVKSIYEKTADMTFARYPISKKFDRQFYIKEPNNPIDFFRLRQQLVALYSALDFLSDTAEMYLDFGDIGKI